MKRILIPLLLSFTLISCNSDNNESISNKKEDISSNEIVSLSENNSSSQEDEYIFDDSIITLKKLDLAINESYPLLKIASSDLENYDYEVDSSNWDIAKLDELDFVHALSLGSARITFYVDEKYYDFIDINVKSDEDMKTSNYLDANRLYQKNVCVFGTSISDSSVTAYPDNIPTFWTEMLQERCSLKNMYNHAKSGSTVGYSKSLDNMGVATISATFLINKDEVKKDVINSDYAFIFTGANDYIRNVNVGNDDDINDNNYYQVESFTGSYNYLINKIKQINPKIKIICMSTIPSTWGKEALKYEAPERTFNNRQELNNVIATLADRNDLLYIYMYDVWKESDTLNYSPDGIHPQTNGYELIYQKLFEK